MRNQEGVFIDQHIADLRRIVDQSLANLVPARHPAGLYDPVRYVLEAGGKRLRPLLVLLTAESFGIEPERALPGALAVEVFHNFTLVHDDIMDRAVDRRGRPTVHEKWDTNTAILSGDLLMGLAYDLLARLETDQLAQIIREFHLMVERLCEGQNLDASFEHRDDVSLEEYLDMIGRKTGALLEYCLWLGAVLGGAAENERERLKEVGFWAGRAFQIQDDLLDLTATDAGWGKPIGGDLVEGKKSFLLLRALEKAEGEMHEWLSRILYGGLATEKVDEARERIASLGVLDDARQAIVEAYDEAEKRLLVLERTARFTGVRHIIQRMKSRLV